MCLSLSLTQFTVLMSLPLVFGAQFCTCAKKKKSSLPLDAETFLDVLPLFPFQFLLIHPSYFMSSILKLWLNWGKSSSQFSVSKYEVKKELFWVWDGEMFRPTGGSVKVFPSLTWAQRADRVRRKHIFDVWLWATSFNRGTCLTEETKKNDS